MKSTTSAIAMVIAVSRPMSEFSLKADWCSTMKPAISTTEVTSNVNTGPESVATRLANLLLGPMLRRGFQRRLHDEVQALKVSLSKTP